MSSTVYYVSARASAGKPYETVQEAHRLALAGDWVLIVQPTLGPINQAASDFKALNPKFEPEVIHSDVVASNIRGAIFGALKKRTDGGRFPAPIKLGRNTFWRHSDILNLIERGTA